MYLNMGLSRIYHKGNNMAMPLSSNGVIRYCCCDTQGPVYEIQIRQQNYHLDSSPPSAAYMRQ